MFSAREREREIFLQDVCLQWERLIYAHAKVGAQSPRAVNRKRDDNGVRMRHASISFDRSQLASVSHANVLSRAHLSLNQFKHVSGSLIVFFLQFTSLMEPPKGIHDKLHDDTDDSPEKRQWKQVRGRNNYIAKLHFFFRNLIVSNFLQEI